MLAPVQADPGRQLQQIMVKANGKLAAAGAHLRISKIEWLPSSGVGRGAATIYDQQVGNKFWYSDFVRGDLRRSGWSYPQTSPEALVYSIDISPDGTPPVGGLTGEHASAAIERAMRTWDARACTKLELNRETGVTADMDLGYLAYIATDGIYGSLWRAGDIQHAGFGSLFIPGAYAFTVDFSFFLDGEMTDIDRNGKADTAFREIYYSPGLPWVDDPDADPFTSVDVESVALHEAGHGLSQDHFGTIFVRPDGTPFTSPIAVMNAIYMGPLRTLQRTDIGGHCGNWGNW